MLKMIILRTLFRKWTSMLMIKIFSNSIKLTQKFLLNKYRKIKSTKMIKKLSINLQIVACNFITICKSKRRTKWKRTTKFRKRMRNCFYQKSMIANLLHCYARITVREKTKSASKTVRIMISLSKWQCTTGFVSTSMRPMRFLMGVPSSMNGLLRSGRILWWQVAICRSSNPCAKLTNWWWNAIILKIGQNEIIDYFVNYILIK